MDIQMFGYSNPNPIGLDMSLVRLDLDWIGLFRVGFGFGLDFDF